MSDYAPTPQQEQAIREYLHESIVPLIEQVLVKKLGQAMSYAAQELVNPKREWVGLTYQERSELWDETVKYSPSEVRIHDFAKDIEAKLKERNA